MRSQLETGLLDDMVEREARRANQGLSAFEHLLVLLDLAFHI